MTDHALTPVMAEKRLLRTVRDQAMIAMALLRSVTVAYNQSGVH